MNIRNYVFSLLLASVVGTSPSFGFFEDDVDFKKLKSQLQEVGLLIEKVEQARNSCISTKVHDRLITQMKHWKHFSDKINRAIEVRKKIEDDIETENSGEITRLKLNENIAKAKKELLSKRKAYLKLAPITYDDDDLALRPNRTEPVHLAQRNVRDAQLLKEIKSKAKKIVPTLKQVLQIDEDDPELLELAYQSLAEQFIMFDPLKTETAKNRNIASFADLESFLVPGAKKNAAGFEGIPRGNKLEQILPNILAESFHDNGKVTSKGREVFLHDIKYEAINRFNLHKLDALNTELNNNSQIASIRKRAEKAMKAYEVYEEARKKLRVAENKKNSFMIDRGLPRMTLDSLNAYLKMAKSSQDLLAVYVDQSRICQRSVNRLDSELKRHKELPSSRFLKNSIRDYDTITKRREGILQQIHVSDDILRNSHEDFNRRFQLEREPNERENE